MAILAEIKYRGMEFDNAYVKIKRIWGSKDSGMSAEVGVAASKESSLVNAYIYEFIVNIPFTEDNTFQKLYDHISKQLTESGSVNRPDQITNLVGNVSVVAPVQIENVVEEIPAVEEKPKKITKRTKEKV